MRSDWIQYDKKKTLSAATVIPNLEFAGKDACQPEAPWRCARQTFRLLGNPADQTATSQQKTVLPYKLKLCFRLVFVGHERPLLAGYVFC